MPFQTYFLSRLLPEESGVISAKTTRVEFSLTEVP